MKIGDKMVLKCTARPYPVYLHVQDRWWSPWPYWYWTADIEDAHIFTWAGRWAQFNGDTYPWWVRRFAPAAFFQKVAVTPREDQVMEAPEMFLKELHYRQ